MATNWAGIRNKSYALPGQTGCILVISETTDRQHIEVTIIHDGQSPLTTDSLSVKINAAQFEALCRMDSSYDGLEVRTIVPLLVEDGEFPEVAEPGTPVEAE
jgi:hypothetical protein